MTNNKGQQAVEFAILMGLILITALLTVVIFGDKLHNFFLKSAIFQTAKTTANNITSPYTQQEQTITSPQSDTASSNALVIETNGLKLTYPADVAKAIEEFSSDLPFGSVEDATGASGKDLIINEIEKLVTEYRKTNPTGDPPIEIIYGNGDRGDCQTSGVWACYQGDAQINMVTIKLNDKVTILQNDKQCIEGTDSSLTCNQSGIYKIEGEINNNQLSGKISQVNNKGIIVSGNYSANIDNQSEKSVLTGYVDSLVYKNDPSFPATYAFNNIKWNFNFDQKF